MGKRDRGEAAENGWHHCAACVDEPTAGIVREPGPGDQHMACMLCEPGPGDEPTDSMLREPGPGDKPMASMLREPVLVTSL